MESASSSSASSLKHRLKSMCGRCFKQLGVSTALHSHNHNHHHCFSSCSISNGDPIIQDHPALRRSSSVGGGRSCRASDDIKSKCRHLISRSRIGPHHRKSHSTDFRYDPLSYSLNFDQDDPHLNLPFRNFTARLPPSPSPPPPQPSTLVAVPGPPSPSSSMEITAYKRPDITWQPQPYA